MKKTCWSMVATLGLGLALLGGCGLGSVDSAGDSGDRAPSAVVCSAAGTNLQAILDQGQDLALCPGAVYPLSAPLHYKVAGQRISTPAATHPREYATLRLSAPSAVHAILSAQLDNVVLEKVVVDGNRETLGAFVGARDDNLALVFMLAAKGQVVRNTVLKNTRTWSSLQLHEGNGQCGGGLWKTTWCSGPAAMRGVTAAPPGIRPRRGATASRSPAATPWCATT